MSRLHLSSKSPSGITEDRDVLDGGRNRFRVSLKSLPGVFVGRDFPDGAGDGVRVVKISLESFTETFIKIQHQEHCQDFTYPTSLFLESCRTGIF